MVACQKKGVNHADLSFKYICLFGHGETSPAWLQELEKHLDSIPNPSSLINEKDELSEFLIHLKKHQLLTSPHIHLNITKDSSLVVFLPISEYNKIKDYTLDDLLARDKKVKLSLKIEKKAPQIYYSNEIITVTEADGQTYWKK